jgi:8-oxo-dGTP pyrophosphatase MutT (NUDIX family)
MEGKHRKVQVVFTAESPQGWWFLFLKTNAERGHFWQNITGSVDPGESFEAAAKRETIEETGLVWTRDCKLICLESEFHFTDSKKRQVHEKVFLITAPQKFTPKLDPHEHEDFFWWIEKTSPESKAVSPPELKWPSNFLAFSQAHQLLNQKSLKNGKGKT